MSISTSGSGAHRAHFLLALDRITDTRQHGFSQGIAFDNPSPCQGFEALFGRRRQRRRSRETALDGRQMHLAGLDVRMAQEL